MQKAPLHKNAFKPSIIKPVLKSSAKPGSKYDASRYLKSPPKTDFYLMFALLALFMTMVLM